MPRTEATGRPRATRPPAALSAQAVKTGAKTATRAASKAAATAVERPRQTVLVLQGGGALGAYQAGVYAALHEGGIEPDWVIGTSIGAINAAIIAGNEPGERLARLESFWQQVEQASHGLGVAGPWEAMTRGVGPAWLSMWNQAWSSSLANARTVVQGIPPFFTPNPQAWLGLHAQLGVEQAAWYQTTPLRHTLGALVDFKRLAQGKMRLTVGAVNVRSGQMHYFDSRDRRLAVDHIMASGALPPAFPAVRIDGEPYWDGGVYSNTPIEAVLDDKPRRDSLIFAINLWPPGGPEPESIWQVMGRSKDIQYASRADSHIARQQQIHRLRHVIRELAREVRPERADAPEVKSLADWGCGTTMHVVRLLAPRLDGEDHTKDIDFTAAGIRARWQAGYADASAALARGAWREPCDPIDGVVVHEAPPRARAPRAP
ncbi:MAG: patatin-like phospholipase family protein [Rubrivivax sp.]|nr:patatin-like phospholipase family protein [Rubrivivax sp.]